MQKSYVVKSPINFANFAFFVRVGDILVHDTSNGNKLTVYRGGEIVRVITHTALGMAALVKQGFVSDLTTPQRPAAVVTPPKPPEASKKAIPPPKPEVKPLISLEELTSLRETIVAKESKRKAKAAVQEETVGKDQDQSS